MLDTCWDLRSLFTVPPEGKDILTMLDTCWDLHLVNNSKVEIIFPWSAKMSTKSFQPRSRRVKLSTFLAIRILIKNSTPTSSTGRYWVLSPLRSLWEGSLLCTVSFELYPCVLILSILNPMKITNKSKWCFLKAFFSQEFFSPLRNLA